MDKDIKAFLKIEKDLIAKYYGRYAVFHNGKVVSIDKNFKKAMERARKKTGARDFFVHQLYTAEEQSNAIIVIM